MQIESKKKERSSMFNSKGEKYCTICAAYHPVEMFYKNRNTPSGYSSRCKKLRDGPTLAQLTAEIAFATKNTLSEVLPNSILCRTYRYERPDAYDLYLERINRINITPDRLVIPAFDDRPFFESLCEMENETKKKLIEFKHRLDILRSLKNQYKSDNNNQP